jgi:glycine/D-amino acid oxidase-like deaminating enzyme/nitrite reductase/ring-hydroxylating ferredoxin subunit
MSNSLWIATTPAVSVRHYPELTGVHRVDVAIVGGGITGITAAYLLRKEGKRVAIVDQGLVAMAESGHTTAHLTEVLDTRYYNLIEDFRMEGAFLAADSNRTAIDLIESIAGDLKSDCQFERVPGYLYTETKAGLEELEREFDAAHKLGLICDRVSHLDLPFRTAGGIRFSGQAQFHPREYLFSILDHIQGKDCLVFEKSRVLNFRDGSPCELKTEKGKLIASKVIVATHAPVLNRFFIHSKIAAYRTYAIAFKAAGEANPIRGLYWDNEDPYHYIRSQWISGDEYVIVGGEDHKVGMESNNVKRFRALEDYAQDRFGNVSIDYHWSGQIIEPVDGLPYIGRNSLSSNISIATGFSGNGMTFGTVAAMILSDWALDRDNRWADLYTATRIKPAASFGEYVLENKDYPTCMIMDRVTPADVSNVDQIEAGEGKILKVEGKKFAIYRDEHGSLHSFSAVCPHLGCIVHWNNAEASWDCPCHGSRFGTDGKVINGPSLHDLNAAEIGGKTGEEKELGVTKPPKKPGEAA